MKRFKSTVVILAGLTVLAAAVASFAQTPPAGQAAPSDQTPPADYRPGLGDMMTMTVQPRHLKLALAGKEKNWSYAAYELHELQEAFDRVAHVWPRQGTTPIAEIIGPITKTAMAGMDQAIQHQDQDEFNTAYKRLTQACNVCHISAKRPMVVIQQPDVSTFPDQNFGLPAH